MRAARGEPGETAGRITSVATGELLREHPRPADTPLCIACWVTPLLLPFKTNLAWRDHSRWREVTTPHTGPRPRQDITVSGHHQWPQWRPRRTCPPTSPRTQPQPPQCTPASMTLSASELRARPLQVITGPWGWGERAIRDT